MIGSGSKLPSTMGRCLENGECVINGRTSEGSAGDLVSSFSPPASSRDFSSYTFCDSNNAFFNETSPRSSTRVAILLVIASGLLSRRNPGLFPLSLGKYPGDALWAVMIFLGLGFVFRAMQTVRIGLAALTFSYAIEFSQIYRAPWIDSIRATTLGHLVLGRGFSWMDIAAYSVGILLACLVETGLFRLRSLR